MTSYRPPYLVPGNTVGIIAPSRKIAPEEVANAIETIASWGFRVKEGKHLYGQYHQFSGTDAERAADLQMMLDDPDIKAIICARGGYGSVRILDLVDFAGLLKDPKWIVGYSDITALQMHVLRNYGIQSMHAIMPLNFSSDSDAALSYGELHQALRGHHLQYDVPDHSLNRHGLARGMLVGGNLSVLYSLMGSSSDIETRDRILFLEDLDEYLYHIDRMMMGLKRSGKLAGIAGLVVGGMTKMNDNIVPFGKTAEEIIKDAVKDYPYPVCFGFQAGHGILNHPLIMGAEVELQVFDEVKVVFT